MKNHQREKIFHKGFLYSLAGTILLSTNFVTAKYGLQGFNPETFSLVWTTAAAIYALVVVLSSGLRKDLRLPLPLLKSMLWLGVITGATMIMAWRALSLLDPSFSAFLWRFAPIFTIGGSVIFLREKLSGKEIVPIALMILGGCISAIGRWEIVGVGIILTLLACLMAAAQMLIAKAKVEEVHPNILVFYRVGIGAIVILFWVLLTGKANFRVETSYWYITLLGAFLGPCASFLLTFRSYRYWSLSRSSVVRTSEPLFVLPLAYIFLHKIPVGKELLGGLVILVGAFWLAKLHFGKKTK